MENPAVSAIVVTYNSRDCVGRCLRSLENQTFKDMEIIVVDNNSHDGTPEFVKNNFPNVNLVENKINAGFSVANNQAIKIAKGKYIAMLNPDAEAEKEWLVYLVGMAKDNPEVGVVGSKILNSEGKIWSCGGSISLFNPGVFRLLKDDSKIKFNFALEGKNVLPHFIDTCACLIRKEMLDDVGLFETKCWCNSEDADLCIRARKKGWRVVYQPFAVVKHEVGHSMGRGVFYYYWKSIGDMITINKNFDGIRRFLLNLNYKTFLFFQKMRNGKEVKEAIDLAVRNVSKEVL